MGTKLFATQTSRINLMKWKNLSRPFASAVTFVPVPDSSAQNIFLWHWECSFYAKSFPFSTGSASRKNSFRLWAKINCKNSISMLCCVFVRLPQRTVIEVHVVDSCALKATLSLRRLSNNRFINRVTYLFGLMHESWAWISLPRMQIDVCCDSFSRILYPLRGFTNDVSGHHLHQLEDDDHKP